MKDLSDSDRKVAAEFAAKEFDKNINKITELFGRIGKPYSPSETFRRSRNYGAKYRINSVRLK